MENLVLIITLLFFSCKKDAEVAPVKIYAGTISQIGEKDPEVIVNQNNLGPIKWQRQITGVYFGVSPHAFPVQRTWSVISGTGFGVAQLSRMDDNTVSLVTKNNAGKMADDLLDQVSFEIRVYP